MTTLTAPRILAALTTAAGATGILLAVRRGNAWSQAEIHAAAAADETAVAFSARDASVFVARALAPPERAYGWYWQVATTNDYPRIGGIRTVTIRQGWARTRADASSQAEQTVHTWYSNLARLRTEEAQ